MINKLQNSSVTMKDEWEKISTKILFSIQYFIFMYKGKEVQ